MSKLDKFIKSFIFNNLASKLNDLVSGTLDALVNSADGK